MTAHVTSIPFHGENAGGDIYYLTACTEGLIHRALILDAMGHGDAASSFADRLIRILRDNISISDNRLMLQLINDAVSKRYEGGGSQDELSPQFATCALGTFDYFKGTFQFLYAGHHAILMRRNGIWQPLENGVGANFPLGITNNQIYTYFELKLESDDWFLMCSDAIFEVLSNPPANQSDLIAQLNNINEVQTEAYFNKLLAYLAGINFNEHYPDDFTLMLLVPRLPE